MGPQAEIIALGNPWRRDDGVGPYLVRGLSEIISADRLHHVTGDLSDLFALFEKCHEVLLVDALDSATAKLKPGQVLRLTADDDRLAQCGSAASSHALTLPQTLALAKSLGCLPEHLEILAISGQDFGHGRELTPAVRRAADRLIGEIRRSEEATCPPRL